MRAVIQRVSEASVCIDNSETVKIQNGILVLIGIESPDNTDDIEWLSGKIVRLRIFSDSEGIMNLSVTDVDGDILVISQFTLHASTKKGNRPSYIRSAKPDIAIPLYNLFLTKLESDFGKPVKTGKFGAYMKVDLINDGPVTIYIDTRQKE